MFAFCHGPRTTTERRTLPTISRPSGENTPNVYSRSSSQARFPSSIAVACVASSKWSGAGTGSNGRRKSWLRTRRSRSAWASSERRSRTRHLAPAISTGRGAGVTTAAAALLVGLLLLLPGLVDHLLGEVGGDLLVVGELHPERPPAPGHGPEVDGVPGHLCLGGQGPDALPAGPGLLHPQDLAPLGVEVAHDVARVAVRHQDVHLHDGLQQ